ncbi:protein lin-28 homolog A [Papio anubis]|uniref:protein lin-28 homolog A n=1 Tax=Papio anubis TaxID=9555 RepID=UPI000B7AFA80|nr:protein lin-28 homolog A [Papio anubis]
MGSTLKEGWDPLGLFSCHCQLNRPEKIWEPLKSRGPSHRYCAGEDVAASSPNHPFAFGLLRGQQPPDQGPGATGSADDHGLRVQPAGSAGGDRDRFLLFLGSCPLLTVHLRGWTLGSPCLEPETAFRFRAPQLSAWPSLSLGGCAKAAEEAPEEAPEDAARAADEPQLLHGAGICKWFNVRMGFGFLSMTARAGVALDPPVDVFVHQSKLHMEGFRSLKEGEAVEFTFKKSAKGLESIRVTGPGGVFCIGSERRPKGKNMQKRRSKGDRCYNCGGLDHHAKECKLPPQPKKCHFCQSISHMVASCPLKAQQGPSAQGKPTYFREEEEEIHSPALLPETQN